MLNVFPSFSLDFIMGLEWETFYYWHRRAFEIKHGKEIPESVDIKVDDESFERQSKRLYEKIAAAEKRQEGTING